MSTQPTVIKRAAAEERRNKRAQKKIIDQYATGCGGFAFQCEPARQVVHLVIHDGEGGGVGVSFTGTQFADLVCKLLSMEVDALPLTITRNESLEVKARRQARLKEAFIDRSARAILAKYKRQKRGAS